MRILLDAHVSGRHIGRPLRKAGHDALALDGDAVLSRLADGDVFALAAREERIVVTYNVSDFAGLPRQWAEARRSHAGLILVPDAHIGAGAILRRLEQLFAAHPDQDDWIDRVAFVSRG